MTLATTRNAIKTAIATTGLRAYGEVPGSPQLDCAVVGWPELFDPHAGFGDIVDYTIPVWLLVRFASNRAADITLMSYLETSGSKSLVAKIEAANPGWSVPNVHSFGPITIGDQGQTALACILDVRVLS